MLISMRAHDVTDSLIWFFLHVTSRIVPSAMHVTRIEAKVTNVLEPLSQFNFACIQGGKNTTAIAVFFFFQISKCRPKWKKP